MTYYIDNIGLLFSLPVITTIILYLKGNNRILQFIVWTMSLSLLLLTINVYLEIVGDVSQAAFTVKLFSSQEPGVSCDLDCCSLLAFLISSGLVIIVAPKSYFLIKEGLRSQNIYFSILATILISLLTFVDILFLHVLLEGVVVITFLTVIVLCQVNNQKKFLFLLAIHTSIVLLFTLCFASYICAFLYSTDNLGSMTLDCTHAVTRVSLALFIMCLFEKNPFK